MGQYDIYLGGVGYHLAKGPDGQLMSGAVQERRVNPFTRYLSQEERWIRQPFRFEQGEGIARADGSYRYESARGIDTRSGKLIQGPDMHWIEAAGSQEGFWINEVTPGTYYDLRNGAGVYRGWAMRFQVPTGKTGINYVAVLVKRSSVWDYSNATTAWNIQIDDDAAGPKPAGTPVQASVSLQGETDPYLPFPDRWKNGEFFWLVGKLASTKTVTPGAYYWITCYNPNSQPLHWAKSHTTGTISYFDGGWTNSATDTGMVFKIKYSEDIDNYPSCFVEYKGVDNCRRIFVGIGNRVFSIRESIMTMDYSATFTNRILQLLEFNSKMFLAQGEVADMWYFDGTSKTTVWTQVTGQQANALAIHDNMLWKADLASLKGSLDGTTTWTANAVTVGDPGTPILSMRSHGGKLYAAKPEGIFEITYPDTYPTSGTPAANLMLDFTTERAPRNFLLDWHTALYFPGYGGVYELRSGLLRNLWTDKIDEGALEVREKESTDQARYTTPRKWSPIYDADPAGWGAGIGSTRGMMFAYSHPHGNPSTFKWYDGRNWHPFGPPTMYLAEYILALHLQDIGGGRGRLWFGCGMNIAYMEWPTWTNDRYQDESSDYDQTYSGLVVLPAFSLKNGEEIALVGVQAHTRNTGGAGGGLFGVGYYLDGGSWTNLGTIDASPIDTLYFPANTKGREIQLQITITVSGTNDTPIMEQIDLLYQKMPEVIPSHQLIIRAGHKADLDTGGIDWRPASDVLDALRAHVDGQTSVTYIDPTGGSHTVRATALTVQYMRQIEDPSARYEAYGILSLLEV